MSGGAAAAVSPCTPRSGGQGGAAGLVPSKTTGQGILVSLDSRATAERRVSRLKRAVWASGHLHGIADHGKRPRVCWFVTLTYADPNGWGAEQVKEAIRGFRRWCKKRSIPCRYTWVAEIQPGRAERTGDHVPHYHLLAWLPVGVRMPKWDTEGWWPHGMTNTEAARSGVGYLMKYLSKLGELSVFPKGLRLYGIGGLDESARAVRGWFNLPQWAKQAYGVGDLARRACGLVVRGTGEILAPVFAVLRVPGALQLRQLRTVESRFSGAGLPALSGYVGAFSSWPRLA